MLGRRVHAGKPNRAKQFAVDDELSLARGIARRSFVLWLAVVFAVAVVSHAGRASAQATSPAGPPPNAQLQTGPEVDTVAPVGQDWLKPTTAFSRGLLSPMTAEPRSGEFTCTPPFAAPIGATPSGYVIGNCGVNAPLHRTVFDTAAGNNWDGGSFPTDFNGCGWINNVNDTMMSETSYTACSTASRAIADYVYSDAQYGYWIWSNSAGNDGLPHQNPHDCPEYANYRPWSSGNVEMDYVGTVPAHAISAVQDRNSLSR